jgi:hypothetical protein
MELTPRNQNQGRTEVIPFEVRVTSSAMPFGPNAVRRAYLRCVRRGNLLLHRGVPISINGVPNFNYAESRVRAMSRAPMLGRLGLVG